MIYTREVSAGIEGDALQATVDHVRDYLAAAVDPDDDPIRRAGDVRIQSIPLADGGVRIIGEIDDAEPDAPYLKPGYSPDAAAEVGR